MEHITINTDNLNSIEQGERIKTGLENRGFNLIKTEQLGFNKFKLTYDKNPSEIECLKGLDRLGVLSEDGKDLIKTLEGEKTHKCLANMQDHKLKDCPSLKGFKGAL